MTWGFSAIFEVNSWTESDEYRRLSFREKLKRHKQLSPEERTDLRDFIDQIWNIYFENIKDYLTDETIKIKIRKELAKKLETPLSFSEVRTFLEDNTIPISIRELVILKIDEALFFTDVEDFLCDETVDWDIREILWRKLVQNENWESVDEFLWNPTIEVWVRLAVWKVLHPWKFETVEQSSNPDHMNYKIIQILASSN